MLRWLFIALLVVSPAITFAGEECTQLGGKCREKCGPDEAAEVGAFLDCSDKEQCCVEKKGPETPERKSGGEDGKEDRKD
jgi:hypothetical protein